MLLVWRGESEAAARAAALHDLARLERQLAAHDARLPDDGTVRIALACAEIDDRVADDDLGERRRLRRMLGELLASSNEVPLSRRDGSASEPGATSGEP